MSIDRTIVLGTRVLMESVTSEVIIAIIRESVTSFALLVMIFLAYKLLMQTTNGAFSRLDALIDAIERIAEKM